MATPDSLGLTYQTLALTTPDHVQLASWVVEPAATVPDRRTTMVLAYGDAGNMSYWLHQARALSHAGYRRQRRQVLPFGGGHQEGMHTLSEVEYGDKYVREISRFLANNGRRS